MELYQLEYFKRVVEECNITRAAESLRIAQPALSQQIKKLEAECGTSLLVRGRKQTIPTPAGQHLYERAQIISDMVDQTLSSIQEMNIQYILKKVMEAAEALWLGDIPPLAEPCIGKRWSEIH